MSLLSSIVQGKGKKRLSQIDYFRKNPIEVQENCLKTLLTRAKDTEFGKEFNFSSIHNAESFANRLPVFEYNNIKPYIEKIMEGKNNVLYPGVTNYFAKSSGTTSDRSKFIPITNDSLLKCHYQSGKDIFFLYNNVFPDTKIFSKKTLSIGGSTDISKDGNSYSGDLSAIIIKNMPLWTYKNRALSKTDSLIADWELKLETIVKKTIHEDVAQIVGVPSWLIVLFNRILETTNKNNILEIWPNLEVFVHGGVNFDPYKELYKKFIPSPSMNYVETYNASEGFFGLQDEFYNNKKEFLLMLDYEIYYEFIELDKIQNNIFDAVPLEDVKLNTIYAMVITTNGGLWRYLIGDTVMFTSKNPYKFILVGRTKNFINLFGEELMVSNADKAMQFACEKTNALFKDYSAAPILLKNEKSQGVHRWLIEFAKDPDDINLFINLLDTKLRDLNSDYDAKRFNDIVLGLPECIVVAEGTFTEWLKSKDKLGGQHKIPRLSNNAEIINEVLNLIP